MLISLTCLESDEHSVILIFIQQQSGAKVLQRMELDLIVILILVLTFFLFIAALSSLRCLLLFLLDNFVGFEFVEPSFGELNLVELSVAALDLSQLITHDLPIVGHLLDNLVLQVVPEVDQLIIVVEVRL